MTHRIRHASGRLAAPVVLALTLLAALCFAGGAKAGLSYVPNASRVIKIVVL